MRSGNLKTLIVTSVILVITLSQPIHGKDNAAEKLSNATNCFTLKLYTELSKTNDNLITSPFSLDVLLSILRLGAGGKTADELTTALGYSDLSNQAMQDAFQSKLSKLTSSNNNTLEVANSIWIQEMLDVQQAFKDIVVNKFYAMIENVNFADKQTTSRINAWGNNKTHGLIPTLFDGQLAPETVMVLVNAIYFKGKWANPFDKDETANGNFYNKDLKDNPSTVKLMHQQSPFMYNEDSTLNAKILEMDYDGGDISMIIILPNTGSSLKKLEQTLTCDNFKKSFVSGSQEMVDVTMPKFETTSSFDLVEPIKKSGAKSIFEGSANFSGIAPNIFVSKAIQKAVIKVYEEGSEAAALTAIVMEATDSVDSGPMIQYFRADHPFLYMIRHKPTNLILFMGAVKNL